ncbi:amidohydrolase family protein [Streptosporangium lutulentum]
MSPAVHVPTATRSGRASTPTAKGLIEWVPVLRVGRCVPRVRTRFIGPGARVDEHPPTCRRRPRPRTAHAAARGPRSARAGGPVPRGRDGAAPAPEHLGHRPERAYPVAAGPVQRLPPAGVHGRGGHRHPSGLGGAVRLRVDVHGPGVRDGRDTPFERRAGRVRRSGPERLVALATVPIGIEGAAQEAARCVEELGMAGVTIGTFGGGRELDDPINEPVWAFLSERQTFCFVHPSRTSSPERLRDYHLAQLLGYPAETALAVARLIFGGVLDRHRPVLCLAHGGGCLTGLAPA